MSTKQIEALRDQSLAARLKRALGGIPTLTLATREPEPEPRRFDREATLSTLRAINGEAR